LLTQRGADFRKTAKRTNFGIPNEINAVLCARRTMPRAIAGHVGKGQSPAVAVWSITLQGGDLPAYDLDCGLGIRQNAPKWRADRRLVLASVTCW
jgi:hypothetical protein